METLRYERLGHVGWLRLNRPQKLNAMTAKMWEEMRTLGQELREDSEVRALVVIGEGRSFSAGIDTSQFGGDLFGGNGNSTASGAGRTEDPLVAAILRTQDAYNWLEEAPYPTIAAVRGHALGAGMQLALACDIRIVARGAQFGLLEHRYGLLPAEGQRQMVLPVPGGRPVRPGRRRVGHRQAGRGGGAPVLHSGAAAPIAAGRGHDRQGGGLPRPARGDAAGGPARYRTIR